MDIKEVKLKTSWYELLGEKQEDMPDDVRRQRWEKWKQMAIENGDQEIVEWWTENGVCEDCLHRDGDWCRLMELPITINPILTMGGGMIGMACMGAGKEVAGQKELEFETADLPF